MTHQPPPPEPAAVLDQRRGLSVLLLLVALTLTVAGSFLPLFVSVLPGPGGAADFGITVTGWSAESDSAALSRADGSTILAPFARNGAMLIAAAVALGAAAVLTARAPSSGSTAAKSASSAAAAFLLAIAGSIGMQAVGWTDLFSSTGPAGPGFGYWLVAAGTVFAIVAAVLVNLAPRRIPPSSCTDPDVSTPRYGFPLPEDPSPPAQT